MYQQKKTVPASLFCSFAQRNTFQVVLATNGRFSFAIFSYADDGIQWLAGGASGQITAQVGFDAGDGERFYSVPGSRTADIVNLPTMTNIGVPGKFVFRIDANIASTCQEGQMEY